MSVKVGCLVKPVVINARQTFKIQESTRLAGYPGRLSGYFKTSRIILTAGSGKTDWISGETKSAENLMCSRIVIDKVGPARYPDPVKLSEYAQRTSRLKDGLQFKNG